ncbi:hypothetical protein ACLOJK_020811 [Asimina triloba]
MRSRRADQIPTLSELSTPFYRSNFVFIDLKQIALCIDLPHVGHSQGKSALDLLVILSLPFLELGDWYEAQMVFGGLRLVYRPMLLVFLLLILIVTSQFEWKQPLMNEMEESPGVSQRQKRALDREEIVKEKNALLHARPKSH